MQQVDVGTHHQEGMEVNRREFLKVAATMAGTIYLPQIACPEPLLGARLGVQIEGRVANWLPYLIPNRLYQWPLRWWSYPNDDYDANALALKGHRQIITLKCVPEQYRLWPEFAGSPPAPQHYGAFVQFAQEVIDRYKPDAIELFNEPDVYMMYANHPEFFGAWVGPQDTMYQGGRRYGAFCAYVYPRLTGCKILAGALMMGVETPDFLRGAMDAELMADAISFHCYIRTQAEFERLTTLAQSIRNLAHLPAVCTETSVLGDGSAAHEQLKADYLRYLRERFGWLGVEAINWYALDSEWENADLIIPGEAWEVWRE